MPRYLRYLIPAVGGNAEALVKSALADSNRTRTGGGSMLLTVRALTLDDAGSFLEIEETATLGQEQPPWDLTFARALSAITDGFVLVQDHWSLTACYGEAVMFCGNTLQARRWSLAADDINLGPAPTHAEIYGTHVQKLYNARFTRLCEENGLALSAGKVLLQTVMDAGAAVLPFSTQAERGFTLMLLGNLERPFDAGVNGWNYREHRVRGLGYPCWELRRDSILDEQLVVQVSAKFSCNAIGIEVPAAGGSFRYCEAYHGNLETSAEGRGAEAFINPLYIFGLMIGELPGMLFGSGRGGWKQVSNSE